MENKILEAVKALGGDLRNVFNYGTHKDQGYLSLERNSVYTLFINHEFCGGRICTVQEFNTYAEQWLKQAYMHNAALDLDWDIDNVKNSPRARDLKHLIADKFWRYYGSDAPANSELAEPGWTDICSVKEFIDYCNANKPCEEVKPEWDGEGLPPVGVKCLIKHKNATKDWAKPDFHETTVVAYGEELAIFNDGVSCNGGLESVGKISDYLFRPIKSPRDKAIDEMIELDLWATDKEYVESVYDWLKQLTPEQKKEFGL